MKLNRGRRTPPEELDDELPPELELLDDPPELELLNPPVGPVTPPLEEELLEELELPLQSASARSAQSAQSVPQSHKLY